MNIFIVVIRWNPASHVFDVTVLAMPPGHDFESTSVPLTFLHSFVSSDFKIASCRKRKAHATKLARISAGLAVSSPVSVGHAADTAGNGNSPNEVTRSLPNRRKVSLTDDHAGNYSHNPSGSEADSEDSDHDEHGDSMEPPRPTKIPCTYLSSVRPCVSPPPDSCVNALADVSGTVPGPVGAGRRHASLSNIDAFQDKSDTYDSRFRPPNPRMAFLPLGIMNTSPVSYICCAVHPSHPEFDFAVGHVGLYGGQLPNTSPLPITVSAGQPIRPDYPDSATHIVTSRLDDYQHRNDYRSFITHGTRRIERPA